MKTIIIISQIVIKLVPYVNDVKLSHFNNMNVHRVWEHPLITWRRLGREGVTVT